MTHRQRRVAAMLFLLGAGAVLFATERQPQPGADNMLRARYSAALPAVEVERKQASTELACIEPPAAMEEGSGTTIDSASGTFDAARSREVARRTATSPDNSRPRSPSTFAPAGRLQLAERDQRNEVAFVAPEPAQPPLMRERRQEPGLAAAPNAVWVNPPTNTPPVLANVRAAQPATSPLVAHFRDRVGSAFALERVTALLDGTPVYSGPGGRELQLFQRSVRPGAHVFSIMAQYRGNAGLFSYTNGYGFTVQGSRQLTVSAGEPASVTVTAFERGGPTEAFEKRLSLALSTR